MKKEKEYTLNFVEEAILGDKELAETHAGGRIEILESDKQYHTEEIRFLLPREIYQRLRDKLDFLKF